MHLIETGIKKQVIISVAHVFKNLIKHHLAKTRYGWGFVMSM
jgi:hypothetical protein